MTQCLDDARRGRRYDDQGECRCREPQAGDHPVMLHQAKGEKANRRARQDMTQRNGENDNRRQHETDQPDRAVGPIIRQSCRARTDHPLKTP